MKKLPIQMTFSDGCNICTENSVIFVAVEGADVQVRKIRPYRFTTGESLNEYKNTSA